ncbi:MAG: L-2-hydroxyglutarate oxidase [Candidatus Dadabacteria bacterium]|nr:L-2-hydroxyglutarate oxidase [Candidatus Dadabacteria bacterium]MYA48185.1 L-2-hydroxyglutarate oxidase [Candidatus Dadabacteria bacterium]MYF47773.1 L-2-hydroxyglutarate oxidase [Candidatus Dadabacteria bacterium]MYG83655.1 L-2-hydroxyglutarate oxidase [Candidatus Dadabacteria bacterium]MYK49540.1 L-2-hydroxyglutarate oxidase [Candidatus Dadabacteria bacterium]
MEKSCDFLVIGGGIVGLAITNELLLRGCKNILILEKEKNLGAHSSGRNSGVLHAGIYYTPDSLKARYCIEGNRLMRDFCRENGVTISECGKVIVADSEEKLEGLEALQQRAQRNGVESYLIDEKELAEIEPHAATFEKAIYSPSTSVFDPQGVLEALYSKIKRSGEVRVLFNTAFIEKKEGGVALTNRGTISYGKLINAAGLHADVVARNFGVGLRYRSIPFMGSYRELTGESSYLVRGNVYPVPDPRMPFLGVHFTRSTAGRVFIGPTAVPVLGRESYRFLEDLGLESFRFLYRNASMFVSDSGFRANALSEAKKYLGRHFYSEARKLIPGLLPRHLVSSAKTGIRSQLVDWQEKKLVMDYVVCKEGDSLHVLNAISPAFTSSMSFAKYLADILLGEETPRVQ